MDATTFAAIIACGVPLILVGNLSRWIFQTVWHLGDRS